MLRLSPSTGRSTTVSFERTDVVPDESFYVLAEWRSDGHEHPEPDEMDGRIPVWNEYVIVVVDW